MRKNKDIKDKKMNKLVLTMPPFSTNNSYRRSKNLKLFKRKEIHEWEEFNLWKIKNQVKKTRSSELGLLTVDLTFFYDNRRANDIDGRNKAVLDLLEKAGAYENDSFITDLFVHKRYDNENPRVEVQIY